MSSTSKNASVLESAVAPGAGQVRPAHTASTAQRAAGGNQAGQVRIGVELRDLVTYRKLFYFLVWRYLKVRYKQTALRVAWAVLRRQYEFAMMTADRVLYALPEKSPKASMST